MSYLSLRAKYGQEKYMNAIHGSDSSDTAARELAFFFPDFVAPKVEGKAKLQRTLALIRPDAYKNNKGRCSKKLLVFIPPFEEEGVYCFANVCRSVGR